MNIFRIAADFSHLCAVLFILYKILITKSCSGISGKSQVLLAIVYMSRYIDLFLYYISFYNSSLKIIFIITSLVIILLIHVVFHKSYDRKNDTFMSEFLIWPCMLSAVWVNQVLTPVEMIWTFSIYLEAVAIIPQFYLILKAKRIKKTVLFYLLMLGLYRTLYVPNWIYRYYNENFFDLIPDVAGVVYTCVYLIGVVVIIFAEVKIVGDEEGLFEKNIFFISDSKHLISEKPSMVTDVEDKAMLI